MSTDNTKPDTTGPIAWMAGNSVVAGLVMAVCLIGDLIMGLQIKQEVFPDFNEDVVTIFVSYPGASPEEVENGIVQAVEEAVEEQGGVVVNSSLMLINLTNRNVKGGQTPEKAVPAAGIGRFRPIILTTLTTFGGGDAHDPGKILPGPDDDSHGRFVGIRGAVFNPHHSDHGAVHLPDR